MNLTKKLHQLLFFIVAISFCACTDSSSDTLGKWYRLSDFDGTARSGAAGFMIGNKGYVSCGRWRKEQRLKDCWAYDLVQETWTQCASLPDEADGRQNAVGFSVNSKGYVTTGYAVYRDDDPNQSAKTAYLKDTWEYDPTSDSWVRKDDFPGEARQYAVAFSIGNYGYVGTGKSEDNDYLKDFYRFDPTAAPGSQWTNVPFPGIKRQGATVFIIDNKAYLVGGRNNGYEVEDFWCFDPTITTENKWTRLRDIVDESDERYDDDYTSIVRSYACAFVIDGQGFLTLGSNGSSLRRNYWIYNPSTDLWKSSETESYDFTPFGNSKASSRVGAICFSTGTRGIITTGSAGIDTSSFYDDTWELKPYEWYVN